MTPYQVNVAAEAYIAVVMAQAGYDVALQYGSVQPDWDIMATKCERVLKLQIKGSQDGGWGLFQSYIKKADYHAALESWLAIQLPDIIYCFVQFIDVAIGQAPRVYIARPKEVVSHMRTTRKGFAYTSMRENYTYTRGIGAGHTDIIPAAWLISQERVDTV